MCRIDDAEMPEFFKEKKVKAKLIHRCNECWRNIQIGEFYSYAFGKWDGVTNTYKTCSHCLIAREWLQINCGGFLFEGVQEEIVEHAQEYYIFGLYRLAVNMGKQWKYKNGTLRPLPILPRNLTGEP